MANPAPPPLPHPAHAWTPDPPGGGAITHTSPPDLLVRCGGLTGRPPVCHPWFPAVASLSAEDVSSVL